MQKNEIKPRVKVFVHVTANKTAEIHILVIIISSRGKKMFKKVVIGWYRSRIPQTKYLVVESHPQVKRIHARYLFRCTSHHLPFLIWWNNDTTFTTSTRSTFSPHAQFLISIQRMSRRLWNCKYTETWSPKLIYNSRKSIRAKMEKER